MHVFIDTNVYLSFYHLSSDDLEELNKLAAVVENKVVTLYLTDQVRDEFRRNREAKIADALKRLKEQQLNMSYPQISKDYPEYEVLREAAKVYSKNHASLLEKLAKDVAAKKLKADETLTTLFSKATVIQTTEAIVAKGRLRMDVGNPPGKHGSLGDAISWELLLANVPPHEDLYFITEDRDYVSALDENTFKDFLLEEWGRRGGGKLYFYKRLSAFFKDKFPHIKLAADFEKEAMIQWLMKSGSFAATHVIIGNLAKYESFTEDQANDIALAATSNNQVARIAQDEDVHAFLTKLVEAHEADIEPFVLEKLKKLLEPPSALAAEDDADIPF